MASDHKKVLRQLQKEQGWTITEGKKHLKLSHPKVKGYITIARTPSDFRALKNLVAHTKRALRQGHT